MRLRKLIFVAALIVDGVTALSSASAGDPAGSYSLVGSNPGGRAATPGP
jgi:hypothetical protein